MRTRLARWSWSLSLVLGIIFGLAPASFAQDQPPPSTATAAATPVPAANKAAPLLVVDVRGNEHPRQAGLGEAVILRVQGLKTYLNGNEEACESLVLFLADVPIPGSPPVACDPADTGEDMVQVRFELDRTADSDHAWHMLLAEPVSFTKKVSVSIGAKGRLAFATKVNDFQLEIVPAFEFVAFLLGLLLALLVAGYLAKATPILRDRVPGLSAAQAPYSLSRFQLAFWSFLVIAAYLFIWMLTEELDTITGSVLALLGIGSATALGATIIDQGKTTDPAKPAPVADPMPSRGFLQDVLSDEQGISLYRFQLFAWTLVLGVIFCASVYNGLEMPQFSTTLLGLMGISSGTYLGFKVPESTPHG
jgi:hypothetical protein